MFVFVLELLREITVGIANVASTENCIETNQPFIKPVLIKVA